MSAFGGPLRKFSQLDLREHEDKILLMFALVISAVVGLVVVAFVAITERLGSILLTADPLRRFLSPIIGSLIGGWLLFRFFPDARGSGIPQTRVALILQKGFISFRTVLGKFVCSSISLGSGVALGREGPSVHIGAGIVSVAARRLGLGEEHVRSLIPVGTAAAIAAAFNTPLAAVLFTLEEILADLHARLVGSVVIGAATSWIILRLILGDEPLFHVPAYQLVHPVEFLLYALLGILGGLVSTVFVKLLLWQRARFLRVPTRWRAFSPAAGGLVVGLLALLQPGVLGVGYNLVSDALNGRLELQLMLVLLALKLIATTASYGSGNAGGVFGPSLFIGAMLGGGLGQVAHSLFPDHTGNAGAYALVGMGVAFAGIVRTPMTSVIMIFEVTRDYTIIVPLMIANLCSYLLAQRLQKLPLYEALSRQEGIIMPSPEHLPEPLTVEDALQPQTLPEASVTARHFVHPDDPLDAVLQRMAEMKATEILVVSRTGRRPLGILRKQDILSAYEESATKTRLAANPTQNWMPAVAGLTVAAVLIASSMVWWQHSRQATLGKEALRNGRELLAQGQADRAIVAFRDALAHAPDDVQSREGLGVALVETGNFQEAETYLSQVSRSQPQNGVVWAALAKIAAKRDDNDEALRLYAQAITKDWSENPSARTETKLDYASLLSGVGRTHEAISALLTVIEESGSNADAPKRAAEEVENIGSPDQVESAYTALATHFPADATFWRKLGDVRFAEGKESAALAAYRAAEDAEPNDPEAQTAVRLVEDSMALDPTRSSLSIGERARRWDLILQRMTTMSGACASPQSQKAQTLVKRHASSVSALDEKMAATKEIWQTIKTSCPPDPVLTHVMAKLK